MLLTKISCELLKVTEDLQARLLSVDDENDVIRDTGELYDFNQTWATTALGFGGMGGSAITTARTYVYIPKFYKKAFVYFAGIFAYECDKSEKFVDDLRAHCMASVQESGKYKEEI